jgi:arylsulfatase A
MAPPEWRAEWPLGRMIVAGHVWAGAVPGIRGMGKIGGIVRVGAVLAALVPALAPGADRGPARLLVVSLTTGFRHASIPTAEAALEEIGRTSGLFHVDFLRQPPGRPVAPKPPRRAGEDDAAWQRIEAAHREVEAEFRRAEEAWQAELRSLCGRAFAPESLAAFDGLVFASTTGDLPVPDVAALLAWVKSGKAFVGFHAASDTFKTSDAYCEMIGGHFAGHPWNATGEHGFVVHEPDHPLTAMFPARFRWRDEIYQYDDRFRPENVRVLVSVDMAASKPREPWHVPVAWIRDYGSGRVFYTNFGHNDATWAEPMFRRHFERGIAWALGRIAAPAAANPEVQAAEFARGAVAAAATDAEHDALRARVDARIAADPQWAVRLRPRLVPLRGLPAAERPAAAARIVGEAVTAAAERPAAGRPNIVLFVADDLGSGELGCSGNASAVTPHLDRFAAAGLTLTDCHSASSCCSPSRAALLTGRHPYRTGVFTWIPEGSPIHLRASEITLPKLLRQAGYDTCHVGKWHLNGLFAAPAQPQPDDHGYAWWLATQNNAAPSHAFPTNFVRNGTPVGPADDHSAPFIAREAVTWLTERRHADRPFFLAVWTHEPHYPLASAERYEKLHDRSADPEERTYRANVTQLDDAFGTVIKALDDLGVADDTLVFFTSDNGPEGAGDTGPGRGLTGGLRGRKRSMYEGGHRVPGLVRWPGRIEPGTVSDLPVIGSDFLPTVLAAADLEPPPGVTLDGVNLLPALAGGSVERPVPMSWRWGGQVAWREGNWKVVADEKLERAELYDLATDRAETTDLAGREPERLAAMLERLRSYTAVVEAEGPDWWRTEPTNGRNRPRWAAGR